METEEKRAMVELVRKGVMVDNEKQAYRWIHMV
jgi:hypothetical protein